MGLPEYDARLGYGFESAEYLAAFDRKKPDALRRDFVEGTEEAVFVLELPKGKYDVLLISGDEEEESSSVFDFPDYGSFARTGRQKPGSYACKVLSVFLEKDGKLKIRIRAEEGAKWKLNAMFINIS